MMMRTFLILLLCFVASIAAAQERQSASNFLNWAVDGKRPRTAFDQYVTVVWLAADLVSDKKDGNEPVPFESDRLRMSLLQIEHLRTRFLKAGESKPSEMSEEERAQWKRIKDDPATHEKLLSQQEVEAMPKDEIRRRIKIEVQKLRSIPSRRHDWSQMK